MLTIILLFLFCSFVVLFSYIGYTVLKYDYKSRHKPCIYNLSINSQIPNVMKALIDTIGFYLQDDLHIIVIQDDINFLDSKFEWPDRAVYIHYSDVTEFLQKYSEDKRNYSLEEIGYFVKHKAKIH